MFKNKFSRLFLFLSLAIIAGIVYDRFIDDPYQNYISEWHNRVIHQTAPAPTQYRILTPYLVECFHNFTGLNLRYSYVLWRIVITFLIAITFNYFLSQWLNPLGCLLGVLIFFATLPLTFVWHFYQPMDLPNLLFFILGYILISRQKYHLLYLLIPVAMLNRETVIFLVMIYFFVSLEKQKTTMVWLNSILLGILGLTIYIILRITIGIKSYYSDAFYLEYNLKDWRVYLYSLVFLNIGIAIDWWHWKDKPRFFRRALLFTPFFVILHWTMTLLKEPRLLFPLGPLFWGLGIWENFPQLRVISKTTTEKPVNPWRYKKIGYIFLLLIFVGFIIFFYHYYSQTHLANRDRQRKVEKLLEEVNFYLQNGNKPAARSNLLLAEQIQPNSDEINYQLGRYYYYYEYDLRKARHYWEKCLQINPDHHAKKEIQFYLSQNNPGQ